MKPRLALAIAALSAIPQGIALAQTVNPALTVPLAPLAGPLYTPAAGQGAIGFYGTDLGITMKHEGQLRILFGDSWAGPLTPSIGPLGDDCQGVICLQSAGCPLGGRVLVDGDAVQGFTGLTGSFFRRPGPPLVFRLNAFGRVAPLPVYAGSAFGTLLDMGPLKTPGAAFSNAKTGSASGAFALFLRPEAIPCSGTCANGFSCDTTLGIDAGGIGCVLGAAGCSVAPGGGICVDTTSPRYSGGVAAGRLRGSAIRTRIGNADPWIHEIYYTQPWDTHKFINPAATTVNSYTINAAGVGATTVADPAPANGPVTNSEKVFLWGRPSFVGVTGQSAKVYLAVVDVPSYSGNGSFPWQPRYYMGKNGAGNPTFSTNQSLAQPLPNADGSTDEPVHIVNQISVRFIAALGKWVMLYGGDMEPALWDGATGGQGSSVVRNPQGAVQIRFAPQPWGPWTAPVPLLNAGNPAVGGGQYGPGGILHHATCSPPLACIPGEVFWDAVFLRNEPGFMYGANLIPEWTEDRGTTVDIYWNVSTWAPYQVTLMRSTITK